MHRGDIDYERFLVKDPDGSQTDIEFDDIFFTVKKTFKDKNFLFQKSLRDGSIYKLDSGDYQMKINRADTANMSFGKYVFDIQFSYGDLLYETFTGDFDLLPEATYPENE
jgi:hypothetical protein